MKRLFILIAVLTFSVHAEPPPQTEQAPEPPDRVPSTSGVDDELEPDVSIITGGISFYALLSIFTIIYLSTKVVFALLPG